MSTQKQDHAALNWTFLCAFVMVICYFYNATISNSSNISTIVLIIQSIFLLINFIFLLMIYTINKTFFFIRFIQIVFLIVLIIIPFYFASFFDLINSNSSFECFDKSIYSDDKDYLFFSYNVMFNLNLSPLRPVSVCRYLVIAEAATKFLLAIPIAIGIQSWLSKKLQ